MQTVGPQTYRGTFARVRGGGENRQFGRWPAHTPHTWVECGAGWWFDVQAAEVDGRVGHEI